MDKIAKIKNMSEQKNYQPRKKIGLALGGGGAKGLAHIGVIKVLEEANIPIDFIAGTSMGALVGGWYAATKSIKFLENIFLKIGNEDLFSMAEAKERKDGNLFKSKKYDRLLEGLLDNKRFEQCVIPFRAVATNLENGQEVIIGEGSVVEGIKASIALPIIFQPVKFNGQLLIDGGFSNPVPADVVREMGADFVIAVDVSSRWINITDDLITPKNMEVLVHHVFAAIEYQLARKVLKLADIVLKPAVLTYDLLEFFRAKEIIEAGRKESQYNLGEIRAKAGYPKREPKTIAEKIIELININPY